MSKSQLIGISDDPRGTEAPPEVHRFATGAVRSKDADKERHDRISPIAMHRLGAHAWNHASRLFKSMELDARAHVTISRGLYYEFLGGEGVESLLDSAWHALAASQPPDSPWWAEKDIELPDGLDGYLVGQFYLPPRGLKSAAEAYAEGVAKYDRVAPFNCEKGMDIPSLANHAIRHDTLFLDGDRTESHLGHSAWNKIMSIHSFYLWPTLNDGKLRRGNCAPPCLTDEEFGALRGLS